MSSENVEALRRLYSEWEKGNMWALRDVAAPGIEWEWSPGLASVSGGPRVYRGLEEIGAATLEWLESWGWYSMTADDFVEVGEHVVVPMQAHAQPAEVDRPIDQPLTAVWTMRDGKAVRVRFWEDPADAFSAAGAPASA